MCSITASPSRLTAGSLVFSVQQLCLCVSVVDNQSLELTTETQRTRRLQRAHSSSSLGPRASRPRTIRCLSFRLEPIKRTAGTAGVPPANERKARTVSASLQTLFTSRLRRVCGRDARGPRGSLERFPDDAHLFDISTTDSRLASSFSVS